MRSRLAFLVRLWCTLLALLATTACGGGTPRASTADLVTIRQPTPDPTLDAVVRSLPRALAGVVGPTPTPTPSPGPPKTAPTSTPTSAKPRR